jgi:hypothetical protein
MILERNGTMEADFTFEASELSWPPGNWPEQFDHGNKRFYILAAFHREGEVQYVNYVCVETGQMAKVFND